MKLLQQISILAVSTFFLAGYSYAEPVCTYQVLKGDTVQKIAKKIGADPQWIRKANKLKGDFLQVGRSIKVSSHDGCTSISKGSYQIQKGDSLAKISKKFKMTVAELERINPGISQDLTVGRSIFVLKKIIETDPVEESEGAPATGKSTPVKLGKRSSRGFFQLTSGPGYEIQKEERAWGTFTTVKRLIEVLTAHHSKFSKSHPLLVHDISRERGGFLPPHHSHRRGVDVDIRYPMKEFKKDFAAVSPSNLDVNRTWALIDAFIQTKDIEYLFIDYKLQKILYDHAKKKGLSEEDLTKTFQFPRGRRSMSGIIRHEDGHKTHLHVRFKQEKATKVPVS